MMRTPDGTGRVELDKFHTPPAVRAEPEDAPVNALGIRRIMFVVDDIDAVLARLRTHGAELVGEVVQTRTVIGSAASAAPRGSSSHRPSRSDEDLDSVNRTGDHRAFTPLSSSSTTLAG